MAYVITAQEVIADNKRMAVDIINRPKNRNIKWEVASLRDALAIYGVAYSTEEVKALVEELVKEGVIEEVKVAEAEPAADPPAAIGE